MNPDFTTVINNYNYARFLRRAIDSVLDQDDPPQLVVVDDGSSDGSRQIIESYGDALRAIFLKNGGQARACLAAMAEVTTSHVHFLDADDAMAPGFAVAIRKVLVDNPAKVQVQMRAVDAQGVPLGSVFPTFPSGYDSKAMLGDIAGWGIPISPPTSGNVFRADVVQRIASGYDYEKAIDGVILYLAPTMGSVVSINRPLVDYCIHGTNEHQQHVLSADRMRREIRRMDHRIDHFRRLTADGGVGKGKLLGQQQEWAMLAMVAEGKRPPVAALTAYCRSLWRSSLAPKRSLSLMAWAGLLTVLHDPARRSLAAWRLSSANRPSIRDILPLPRSGRAR